MSIERLTQDCPTCGSQVEVIHDGEGQPTYVPLFGKGSNGPVPSSYEEVAALLRNMADHVEAGDSFEGSCEWSMPDIPEHVFSGQPEPADYEHPDVMLRAVYRVGNSMGQGGVRIIGTLNG